jgi:hypothetical protein
MVIDFRGNLISGEGVAKKLYIPPSDRKNFWRGIKASGFAAMYPILFDAAPVAKSSYLPYDVPSAVADAEQAHRWPEIIGRFKQAYSWHEPRSRQQCWRAITKVCLRPLQIVVAVSQTSND